MTLEMIETVLRWSGGLMMQAVNILLEGTPAHINLKAVEEAMRSVPNVAAVHDLHVWTITSGMDALSAHVVLAEGVAASEAQNILGLLSAQLKTQYSITHTTLQVEYATMAEKETRL